MNRKWMPLCVALALATQPILARADEDSNMNLPPAALAAQRNALGIIALVVLAGVVYYYVRRWQTIKSGKSVDGSYRDQD